MISASAVVLLPGASRAASGEGAAVDLGANDTLRLVLELTVIVGAAPSLIVGVETSADQASWRPLVGWSPRTAPGIEKMVAQPCDRFARATWRLVENGASCTFRVGGDKLRPYAHIADLKVLGVSGNALVGIAPEVLERALSSASSTVDSYLAHRYTRPILLWGDDVREKTCMIAAWRAMSGIRGFNPEVGSDASLRLNHDDAMKWLREVREGLAHPEGLVDSEGSEPVDPDNPTEPGTSPVGDGSGGAIVFTRRSRRWS